MKPLNSFILPILAFCFSHCAPIYHDFGEAGPISYLNEVSGPVIIQYSHISIFVPTDNPKYLKRSQKKGFHLFPLKIVNTGNYPITLTPENFSIYNGAQEVSIIPPSTYRKKLKRRPWVHAFYLLPASLPSSISGTPNSNQGPEFTWGFQPYQFLVIPAAVNFWRGTKSNKRFKEDVKNYDLLGKRIAPGEAFEGFLCIPANYIEELTIEWN